METRSFPGRYDSLEKISQFVVQAARQAGLDDRAIYAVELAVDEACSNIIDHAYTGEGKGDFDCSVVIGNGEVTIILRDRGKPFDPDKIPKPLKNVPLNELRPRGVGFYLMSKMMDEISYKSNLKDGNTLTMVKRK
jgi:anti-sigma regulatory factor (Ser/Thr protein kinase)